MDYYKPIEKRSITLDRLVRILNNEDVMISRDSGELLLELIYKLSNLAMSETLKSPPERYISSKHKSFTRHSLKNQNYENS